MHASFPPAFVSAACVIAALAGACSLKLPERPSSTIGDTVPTLPTADEVATPEEACRQWAKAMLARESRCDFADWPDSPRRADQLRAVAAQCESRIANPQISGDAADKLACARALGSASCGTTPRECEPKKGWADVGSACAIDEECGSLYCALRSTSEGLLTCGTCQAVVEAGESCASTDGKAKLCARGLVCSSVSKRCVSPGTYSSCKSFEECASNRACVIPAGQTSGTCAEAVGKGEACESWSDCEGSLLCDGETKKCVSPVHMKWREPGESCDFHTRLCAAGSCIGATVDKPGTCSTLSAKGASCSSAGSSRCDLGLYCFEGKCASLGDITCL